MYTNSPIKVNSNPPMYTNSPIKVNSNPPMYTNSPIKVNSNPPMYTNSPIKVNTNPIISNNRLSVNNSLNNSGQFDSPLDAPPRLTKFFGYMPSEVVSPIKIADDFQQDLQKMEDMTNNFYLSPLNPSYSPSITQSFSNLHINTNVNSGASTPHRSYNSAASTPNGQNVVNNIPSAHLNSAVDPSVSISPLANKTSSHSLSSTNNNNRPFSMNIDPTAMNHGSLDSPVSSMSVNKRFSVQPVERLDRGLTTLPNLPNSQSLGNVNLKRFSSQSLQPPAPAPEPHQTVPLHPRSSISSLSTDSLNPGYNHPLSMSGGSSVESYPSQQNSVPLFLNKPTVNKNYR